MVYDYHVFMKNRFAVFLLLGVGISLLSQPAVSREKSLLPNQGTGAGKDLAQKGKEPLGGKSASPLPKEKRILDFHKKRGSKHLDKI